MPIVFNGNGEVEDWSHLDTCLPEATANMKQLVKDSIIRVADTIELKNVKASIKTLFIRYDLTANSPSIRNLTWHYDDCSLTLTTLISDYQQGNISFSGGELNFAKAKYPMHSKELHDSLWKGEIDYDPQTIRTFKYPYNGGFFFDNIDTRHKVSDIIIDKSEISSECVIERRIFSLFLKFNKEALDKILVENQAKSEF